MAKTEDGLTDKQAAFVEHFLVTLNATQAAIDAGYSEKTAHAIGWENLRKPEIIEALNRRRAELSNGLEITPDRILKEYSRIGFSDVRKAVKWKSNLLTEVIDPDSGEAAGVYQNSVALVDSAELDDDTALAISEVKMDSRGGMSIKLYDKKAALDSMAKHLGMFEGKKGVDDPETDPEADNLRAIGRKLAFVLQGAVQPE